MSATARRARTDRGAAAVEFALILPLFVMLSFGVISAGFLFETWLSTTQAARETSRFAATFPVPKDTTTAVEDVDAWFTKVKTVAVDTAGIDAGDAPSYVICIRLDRTSAGLGVTQKTYGTLATLSGNCTGSTVVDDNTVQVLIAREGSLNIVLWSSTVTVQGSNTSRYEPRPS